MTLIPLMTDDDLDPDSRRLFAGLAERGAAVPDLYRLLANTPDLLQAWTGFAWPLRAADHANRALRELLIMRTAQLTGANYEWAHHWSMALAAGVKEAELHALQDWRRRTLFDARQRAALAFTDEMVRHGKASSAHVEELRELLGDKATIQIALTVAFYLCVARFAATFELGVEPGFEHVPSLPTSGPFSASTLE
jgi:alkylhydroperoxidase family enzyme